MGPRPYLSGVHSLLLITVRIRSRVPVTCFPHSVSLYHPPLSSAHARLYTLLLVIYQCSCLRLL